LALVKTEYLVQTIKGFSDQVTQIWKSSTPAARFGIVLLSLLCATVIGGVGYWSSLPQYVELASNLEPNEFSDIVTELDRAGISYEMKGAGNTLFVDRRYWSQAQGILRQKGPVSAENSGAGDGIGMFPLPEEAKNASIRRLERALKASLKTYAGIQDADVYLSIPDRSGFLRPTSDPPRASISLTLQKGARFSEAQAAAMAQHVANSVVGLELSNVGITDKEGRTYTVPDEELRTMLQQDELRRSYEARLLNNLQSMIGQILGIDNVSVRVAADVTVHDNLTTVKKLDAQNTVTTFEKTNSKTRYGASEDAIGGAGTMTNVSGGGANGKPNQLSEKSEELESKTDSGHQIQETKLQEIKVNRLSVSVVANSNSPLLQGENPLTADELKTKIETIVKGAAGFVENRDFVAVEVVPFAEPDADVAAPPAGFPWEQINKILQNVSLGIAAILAFLVTLLALRKFGNATAPTTPPVQLSQDNSNRVNQLSQLLTQNPEVFSRIIAAWADSSASQIAPATESKERKAA
jgi:flagellar M-ring protein FliF